MSVANGTDTQSDALHVADSHDLIRVHGARENNLKDVSVEIPKRRLTVFIGVSGVFSGHDHVYERTTLGVGRRWSATRTRRRLRLRGLGLLASPAGLALRPQRSARAGWG